MSPMSVTDETSQPERGWSKEVAPSNMPNMLVAEETSQSLRGWSKEVAPENMLPMLMTEETSQSLRGWSKEVAPRNMPLMSVTEETSQEERSPSNEEASKNMSLMSVTPDRSGASVARYAMLAVPSNIPSMVVHSVPPHCSIDSSWDAFGISPSSYMEILSRPSPSTVTV